MTPVRIITPLKYHVFENNMENGAFAAKVNKTLLNLFFDFFNVV